MDERKSEKAYFHLPGLFEFCEFYKVFLPLFREHKEYFYDFAEIGSIYGAPADCLWGGGRVGYGDNDPKEVCSLMREYGISARLTFSNSLLEKEHLADHKCNRLCRMFSGHAEPGQVKPGIILASDLLLDYLKKNYPDFYFVSSTTKVITDWDAFLTELEREDFAYICPDFRFNKNFEGWKILSQTEKNKVEFLCNECCDFECKARKECYRAVSRRSLGIDGPEFHCQSPYAEKGYVFSRAMKNPGFISVGEIREIYMPMGFSNFKIEGRSLGSALLLEFILYYMTKPEYQINVREAIYLDANLDLF
ncbi:MAG: hypothetical protein U0L49_01095 [Eubacterium sp.]|nr:hypothetical protein [Eubacterium sp.]